MSNQKKYGSWSAFLRPGLAAAIAEGRVPVNFSNHEEVGNWVEGYGADGEAMLRTWLDREDERGSVSRSIARGWLAEKEAKRAQEIAAQQLEVARASVEAARKSAKWAMFAAFASAGGTVVTALVAYVGYVQSLKPVEIKVINAHEFIGVQKSDKSAKPK